MKHIANAYLDLRTEALKMTSDVAGAPATDPQGEPYGVVTDIARPQGYATIVAMFGGAASIYFSGGGGNIGGEGQPAIRKAARRVVDVARAVVVRMQPAHKYPLPRPGNVEFFVLTKGAVLSATFTETDLHDSTQPFGKLYAAVQDIITQYRLISQ
jgi:hypothetical protein